MFNWLEQPGQNDNLPFTNVEILVDTVFHFIRGSMVQLDLLQVSVPFSIYFSPHGLITLNVHTPTSPLNDECYVKCDKNLGWSWFDWFSCCCYFPSNSDSMKSKGNIQCHGHHVPKIKLQHSRVKQFSVNSSFSNNKHGRLNKFPYHLTSAYQLCVKSSS